MLVAVHPGSKLHIHKAPDRCPGARRADVLANFAMSARLISSLPLSMDSKRAAGKKRPSLEEGQSALVLFRESPGRYALRHCERII